MNQKGDTFRMDPYYLILFFGFGLLFGITGTAIVYAVNYLPADRRVAGVGVFFCGCAAKYFYGTGMPPTPGIPVPLIISVTGFLIHPLFIAAGVLIFSGLNRYHDRLRKETVFSALFLTAGITAVLGSMGFYTVLQHGAGGPGAPDFAIIPSLFTGLFDTCLAAVIFMGACELHPLLQKRDGQRVPEK